MTNTPAEPLRRPGRVSLLAGPILALGLLAGCATARPAASASGASPYLQLFERCSQERRARCDCASLPTAALDRALGNVAAADPERGSGSIGATVTTDALASARLYASELLVSVAGDHRIVWWNAGAGVLHRLESHAYGFSLAATVGFRLGFASRWSLTTGARFLNVSSYYADEPREPAQHVYGTLGADVVAFDRPRVQLRVSSQFLLGVRHAAVARYESAHEVVDDILDFDYGGLLAFSVWLR